MTIVATCAPMPQDWTGSTEEWDEHASKLPRNCQVVGFDGNRAVILMERRLRFALLHDLHNVWRK